MQHDPIYESLAVPDGIHLPSAKTRQRHGLRQVVSVMKANSQMLSAEMAIREAREQVRSTEHRTWLIVDERGVIGVISRSSLERKLAEVGNKKLGETLDALTFPHVHPDQTLDLALQRMDVNQLDIWPVVGRADVHELRGIVILRDVLNAYGLGPNEFGVSVNVSRTADEQE